MAVGRLSVGAAAELASLARTVARRAAGDAPTVPDADIGVAAGAGVAAALPVGTEETAPSAGAEFGTALVGAAFEAADLARDATALAWRTTAPVRAMAGWLAQAPPARPVTARVEATVARWAERGAAETEAGRVEVRALGRAAVDEVAASQGIPATVGDVIEPMLPVIVERALPGILETALPDVMAMLSDDPSAIGGVVDALLPQLLPEIMGKLSDDPSAIGGVVDSLLPSLLPTVMDRLAEDPAPLLGVVNTIVEPLLAELLPTVVDQLGENPEPIRELVMGQSTSIAGDMVESVRARAVTGDERAERIARKLLFRKQRPELASSTVPELNAGAPQHADSSDTSAGAS